MRLDIKCPKNNTGSGSETHNSLQTNLRNCGIRKYNQHFIATNTQPYLIEIYDSATNTLLYSCSHIFSPTSTSYISINPIVLNVGNSYTIKRTQTIATSVLDLICRVIINLNQQIGFPITFGSMKITSSSFNNPFSAPNAILPYIDIVFE